MAGARTGEVADGARRARHEHPAVDEDERRLRDRARAGCRDHLELHAALSHMWQQPIQFGWAIIKRHSIHGQGHLELPLHVGTKHLINEHLHVTP